MITLAEAIQKRHSVRNYKLLPIEAEKRVSLQQLADKCNAESGLHISLVFDESEGFSNRLAHYGHFKNVRNYIVLAGPRAEDIDERCGYYGEQLVLFAMQLGLSSCWVGLTYNKSFCKKVLQKSEKLSCVISIGYGNSQGVPHKGKSMDELYETDEPLTPAFKEGLHFVELAPTATNQQKFKFLFKKGQVSVKKGIGFYSKVDLGIVKYHFEVGSGINIFSL